MTENPFYTPVDLRIIQSAAETKLRRNVIKDHGTMSILAATEHLLQHYDDVNWTDLRVFTTERGKKHSLYVSEYQVYPHAFAKPRPNEKLDPELSTFIMVWAQRFQDSATRNRAIARAAKKPVRMFHPAA